MRNGIDGAKGAEMIQLRRNGEGRNGDFPAVPRLSDPTSQAALHWLERETTSRLLVDRNLRILWANNAAASALDASEGLRNRGGTLTTGDKALDVELRGLVGRASSTPSGWTVPCTQAGEDHLVLHFQKITESEPATYGLSFHKTGDGFRAAYAPLERIFDLTPVEHRTLLDLLDGHEAIAIARFRDVSVETVRSHIRNIYLKLGVRTREGLFHKLRAYQIRI